jgi:hypothetical protein
MGFTVAGGMSFILSEIDFAAGWSAGTTLDSLGPRADTPLPGPSDNPFYV